MSTESTDIPTTMKRLVVKKPGDDITSCVIEVEEVPVPQPGPNQVLVRVVAAAVNPSDYEAWKTVKSDRCPVAMGNEGSGVVVASGGGVFPPNVLHKIGSHVGIVNLPHKQGTYSEYVVASVTENVINIPQDMPVEDAASFFVNPYTAVAIFETAKREGTKSKAFVHTAAASQLGQMLNKLAPSEGIEVINIVRREEQAELLKKLGAKHVIVTSDDTWKEALKSKIKEMNVTVAFDAIAGKMTGDLLDLLPPKGTVFVYGRLGGRVENVDPISLIYREKKIKGFFLTTWLRQGGLIGMLPRMFWANRKVCSGLNGGWSSTQFTDTTMENVQADLVKLLEGSITGQKLRIRFDNE